MTLTGQHLNERYWVAMLIEQGGFGAVYKAWDIVLDRPCALKESYETSPEGQRQFLREAQILASLTHPNLPRVTDFFTIPEQGQYLVMDFVEGKSLEELRVLAGERLPEAQALGWIAQVLDALIYIHRQDSPVIHRDIKPTNIKITPPDENYSQGRAVLVDFGVAKTYDSLKRTTMGARAVTPGYSPIEQYGMGVTDARTDIYALGATLYTLLTGQEPPESPRRVLRDPLAPPRQLNPDLSPEIEAVILQAMRSDPDERLQTAREFKAAISGLLPAASSQQAVDGSQQLVVSSPPPAVAIEPPSPLQVDDAPLAFSQPVAQPDAVASPPGQARNLGGQTPPTGAGAPAEWDTRGDAPPASPLARTPALPAAQQFPWKKLGLGAGLLVALALVVGLGAIAIRNYILTEQSTSWHATWTAMASVPELIQTSQARGTQTAEALVFVLATTHTPAPSPLPSTPTPSPVPLIPTDTPSGPFEYTVQEGDTLTSIAEQFDTDLVILLALNPTIDVNTLSVYIGQKILIPAPDTLLPTATPVPTTVTPGTVIVYTVLPGDTLEAIATLFRSSVRHIVEENELENVNDIYVGQVLKIPVNIASPVDGMAQVYIPGGTFLMGSESGGINEGPVHTVTLDAFWMDQTEVTNGMYAQCVAAGECSPPVDTSSYSRSSYYGDAVYADYPVISVAWSQAAAYCRWAERELPTEAQWEYAARGGLAGALYPWGDTFDGSLANFCDANCSLSWANPNFNDGYADTAPVGSYPANGYGLFDMAGNVWEWVADWGGEHLRLLRGGSWYYVEDTLRVSFRYTLDPGNTYDGNGFRCARSP
jgi:formylglycine-generating enzyme required for sulfatase activity/serine/threonine protein kinase